MTRFLFVTWPGAGNQVPAIGLAAELVGHRHQVSFAGYAAQRERFEQAGFRFVVLENAQRDWPTTPPPDWMPVLGGVVWASQRQLADLPAVVAAEAADVVVIDCLMFGALAAAEQLSVPTAVLVHSAPGAIAPPGGALETMLLGPINGVRKAAELDPVGRVWDAWSSSLALCTSIEALDPLAADTPESFRYVGPIQEPVGSPHWRPRWSAADPRPLVVASFSTGVAWDQTSRIERTLAAVGGDGHRLLVTTGTADVSGLEVPGDAQVEPYVPHAHVLPNADVMISHAGHGTVAAALAHGVPMVSLPNMAADQPAMAAQVARLGAGVALDGDRASVAEIADAVAAVQRNGYRRRAGELAQLIARSPGAAGAAVALEDAFG